MTYPSIYFRKKIKGPYGAGNDLVKYDWYVNGNLEESGNGRSLNAGFLTLAEGIAAAGVGATIWVERLYDGTPYRESLLPDTGQKIYSSGVYDHVAKTWSKGARISGADVIANATFAKTGGLTYVYEKSVEFDTTGVNTWIRVWEDDVSFTLVANAAACDATAGTYFISSHTASPATLYVHASDDSDVTANGKVYEFNKRTNVIEFTANAGITIQGIEALRGNNNNGSFCCGRNATVSHCKFTDGTKHNAFFKQDTTVTDCLAYDAYYAAQGSSMVVVADTNPSGAAVVFTRVDCVMPVYDATIAGFFFEVVSGGSYTSVTFTNCDCSKVTTGFSGAGANAVVVSGCTAADGLKGIQLNSAAPWTVSNCTFSGTNNTQAAINSDGATLTITNTTLTSSHASPLILYGTNNSVTVSCTGCTFNLSNANAVGIYLTGTGINLTVNNCEFNGPGDLIMGDIQTGAGGDTYVGDNNHFDDATPRFRWAGGWVDFATWKTNTGQDTNSTAG